MQAIYDSEDNFLKQTRRLPLREARSRTLLAARNPSFSAVSSGVPKAVAHYSAFRRGLCDGNSPDFSITSTVLSRKITPWKGRGRTCITPKTKSLLNLFEQRLHRQVSRVARCLGLSTYSREQLFARQCARLGKSPSSGHLGQRRRACHG